MSWGKVGEWLKSNGKGVLKVAGAVMTGGPVAGVAAVASLVAGATGETEPAAALSKLQTDPATMIHLQELANANEADIRKHHAEVLALELQDKQAEHHETQETIRAGDRAEDRFVRWTRPGQSWVSLAAALAYAFVNETPDTYVLGALLALPWAYAGLRQVGKGIDSLSAAKVAIGGKK